MDDGLFFLIRHPPFLIESFLILIEIIKRFVGLLSRDLIIDRFLSKVEFPWVVLNGFPEGVMPVINVFKLKFLRMELLDLLKGKLLP